MGLSSALFVVTLVTLQATLSVQDSHGGDGGDDNGDMGGMGWEFMARLHGMQHEQLQDRFQDLHEALEEHLDGHDSSEEDDDEYGPEDDTGMNLIMAAVVKQFLSSDDRDVSDFVQSLLLHHAQTMAKPANSDQLMMKMYYEQIFENPKADNVKDAMAIVKMIAGRQPEEYKSVIRTQLVHHLSQWPGEDEAEILGDMLHFLLSAEQGGGELRSREVLLLVIQRLMALHPGGATRSQMFTVLMRSLLMGRRQESPQAQRMLRMMIEHFIVQNSDMKSRDTPEDDRWKFYPPLPCRVQGPGIGVFNDCGEDSSCSVGPYTDSEGMDYYLCETPINYLVYHACDVRYSNGTELKTQGCELSPGSECTFGPFDLDGDGHTIRATYCSTIGDPASYIFTAEAAREYLANFTVNIWGRACRISDSQNFVYGQRHCPLGYMCVGGPLKVPVEGVGYMNAFVCDNPYADTDHFMDKLLGRLLGFGDDDDDDNDDDDGGDDGGDDDEDGEDDGEDHSQYEELANFFWQLHSHFEENEHGEH